MDGTWTSITWKPCQSHTHPIWTWDVSPPYTSYSISEPWIVTVRVILQGVHQYRPSGIGPCYPETTAPWTYLIRPTRSDPKIPWIGPGLPWPWRKAWTWECHVQEHVRKLLTKHWYQHGGFMGSQEALHVLEGKILNCHVREISCHLDVILNIVLDLVGVWYLPRIIEDNL